jgi:uncharacterized protein (DUF1800 family)
VLLRLIGLFDSGFCCYLDDFVVIGAKHMLVTEPKACQAVSKPSRSLDNSVKISVTALSSALTTACGGGGASTFVATGTTSTATPITLTGLTYTTAGSDEDAARFLLQAQFSASDAEIAAVRTKGYASWLSQQFAAPMSTTGIEWLNARGYATIDNATRYYDNSYPGDYMIWNQLMTSSDAVRKRMALALSEFFVVSLSGLDLSWRSHAIAAWWDMLVSNAFGNFRTLLEGVTLNAAMGYYLNTKGSLKENVKTGRAPDENYGREIM